jgi:hypothetical protein
VDGHHVGGLLIRGRQGARYPPQKRTLVVISVSWSIRFCWDHMCRGKMGLD